MKLDGGVGSVMVMPLGMKNGGPAEKLLAEGPPEGPTQLKVPDERMITNRVDRNLFSIPVPDPDGGPISSEPFTETLTGPNPPGPGMKLQEFLFTTPTLNPQEVLPVLPFMPNPAIPNQRNPFIEGFFDPMPKNTGGIPNLMQANITKPAGILTITKEYDI